MNRTPAYLLPLILSLAGCGDGANSCVTDDECFRGEVCVDKVCEAPGSNNTAPNNMTPNNTTTNNTTPNNTPNNTTPNNATTNNTTNTTPNNTTPNNSITGMCKVDPFTAMCPADDNDDFWEYLFTETGRGCLGGGDDWMGGEFNLLNQTLCPLEAADKFNTNLIPCDNITFIVEVTVTPHQQCNPDDWGFNVRLQGNDCIETNGKMRCETLADGSKRATGFLEPDNSVTSPYIDITPIAENLQFDYDLQIIVRE